MGTSQSEEKNSKTGSRKKKFRNRSTENHTHTHTYIRESNIFYFVAFFLSDSMASCLQHTAYSISTFLYAQFIGILNIPRKKHIHTHTMTYFDIDFF